MKILTSRIEKLVKQKDSRKKGHAKSGCKKCADGSICGQKVEKKAYELYEKRGCQDGHDLDDWLEAEKIIEQEMISG